MDLTGAEKNQQEVDDLVEALDSKMFKALTDPTRTLLLKYLLLNGRSDVSTIAAHMPQDRSVISRHLNMMAEAGLLVAKKETRHRFYKLKGEAFLHEFEAIVKNIRTCMGRVRENEQ
ncbi:MAG: metalloregulator ArsR/SmtB family transcription factor [Thermodesulfobacteriota bacterium]